jgi:hypothetical protein
MQVHDGGLPEVVQQASTCQEGGDEVPAIQGHQIKAHGAFREVAAEVQGTGNPGQSQLVVEESLGSGPDRKILLNEQDLHHPSPVHHAPRSTLL